jgi:hypothetical protein
VEPGGVGGLGVLDPSLLLHGARLSTPVLAAVMWLGQGACCCRAEISRPDPLPPLSGKLSPLDLKTRGLEDMTNASLQRSRQS